MKKKFLKKFHDTYPLKTVFSMGKCIGFFINHHLIDCLHFLLEVSSKRYAVHMYTAFIPLFLPCTPVGPWSELHPICNEPFVPRATQFVFHVDISASTVVGKIMV